MCTHCFKSASEPSRYKILKLLERRPYTVGELTERVGLKQPTVTHHIKQLFTLGLLKMKKKGREHWYSLNAANECISKYGLLKKKR